MRVAKPPPSTGGARGGSKSEDAPSCLSVCSSSGAPARTNVQRRASEEGSDRNRNYMFKNKSGGNVHKKKKKKKSRWRRFDGESARQYEKRMEVDIIRDLEEAYEGTFFGKHDSGRLDKGRRSSKRLKERQRRAGRYRNNTRRQAEMEEAARASDELLDRLEEEAASRGSGRPAEQQEQEDMTDAGRAMEEMRSRLRPNEQDILDRMNGEPPKRKQKSKQAGAKRVRVPETLRAIEQARVEALVQDWKKNGHGHMQVPKPEGVLRLSGENIETIGVSNTRDWVGGTPPSRPRQIDALRKQCGVDVQCTMENRRNWDLVASHLQYSELFGKKELTRSIAGHNIHSKVINQYGGTGMTMFGRLSTLAVPGKDESGLGRATWMLLNNDGCKLRIITAYRPNRKPSRTGPNKSRIGEGETVWEQHWRYYRSQGVEDPKPRKLFDEWLFGRIKEWRKDHEEILLLIDANEDIYKGPFADHVAEVGMECAYFRLHQRKMPPSHSSLPIMACLATPGVDVESYFIGRFGLGVGDHRGPHFIDVSLESALGTSDPRARTIKGRKLQAKTAPRLVKKYNADLKAVTRRHKMKDKKKKIGRLVDVVEDMPDSAPEKVAVMARCDKWDDEYSEQQLGCENRVRKKRVGKLDYSPEVKKWIHRRNILHGMIRYHKAKQTGRNLKIKKHKLRKQCRANDLPIPSQSTLEQVEQLLQVTIGEIERLKPLAAAMRKKHNISRLEHHIAAKNKEAAAEMRRIINREGEAKWKRVGRTFKRRQLPVSRVATRREGGGRIVHAEEVDVNAALREHLGGKNGKGGRYKTARSAPIARGRLLRDLGHLADTPAAKEILEGTYCFPPGTDEATILILKAAAAVYVKNKGVVKTILKHKDFLFWRKAKEKTESSKSGQHFGHYISQSFSKELTDLKLLQLNIVLRMGMPLRRWLHGLTVMLEKEAGNCEIDKLRAICLFEADLNWVLKMIYAKRMMENARENDLVPPELFATAGQSAPNATMAKVMFTDHCRINHRNHAVASVDLGQCYDAVAHGFCSLALQAFGVPIKAVKLMLLTLQTMNFWLRTAYGEDKQAFGGTPDDPFYGISQGAGSAPPTYTASSTLAIEAYKMKDFHPTIRAAITGMLLTIAAVLFVDDTDQFHLAKDHQTEQEFVEQIQAAITFWGMIVLATGGYLKQSKCQVGLVLFDFRNGVPRIKKISKTPKHQFTIPQKDDKTVPIPTIEADAGTKSLGVMFDLENKGKHHVGYIKKKGAEWTSKLNSAVHIGRSDAWCSFMFQLEPSLAYSLETLSADPTSLEKAQRNIFYQSLSRLGVNQHIIETVRRLPRKYGGLNMFDLNVKMLGAKLHYLRSYWGTRSEEGDHLQVMYEDFRMDVGLGGNVFARDYDKYEYLAEHSWFKHLWHLCHMFKCELSVDFPAFVQHQREGDRALMDVFLDSGLYSRDTLKVLNRVRRFKKVHLLSDILCADGKTVNPCMLSPSAGASTREFSLEKPTRGNKKKWNDALRDITSTQHTLETPLGKYLTMPHNDVGWYASTDERSLFHLRPDGDYDVFQLPPDYRSTRRRTFRRVPDARGVGSPARHKLATVSPSPDGNSAVLHSTAAQPATTQQTHDSLLSALRASQHPDLWDNFECDGDGWWIGDALFDGTLNMVSDGSYMQDRHEGACSGAFVLHCSATKRRATCSWAELQTKSDNYRGELLGSIGFLTIIREVLARPAVRRRLDATDDEPELRAWTDCKGVITHGNDPDRKLKQGQAHADLIRVIQELVRALPIPVTFKYVPGHQDKHVPYRLLTLEQQLNVDMDKMAKKTLKRAIRRKQFITSILPLEKVRISINGNKVIRSPTDAIYDSRGRETARTFYCTRKKRSKSKEFFLPRRRRKARVKPADFDLIDFDSLDGAMTTWPQMFRVFYTKHITGCCQVNHFRNVCSKGAISAKCPCCQHPDETTAHVLLCENPTRKKLYYESLTKMEAWMKKRETDPRLISMITSYLRGRSTRTMTSCHEGRESTRSRYYRLATHVDRLGWQNLTEGRIPKSLERTQCRYYHRIKSRKSSRKWAAELIDQIFKLTHLQWKYRNNFLKYRANDSAETVEEYESRMRRIEEFLELTDPEDLLEEDRFLVEEYSLEKLAAATSTKRIVYEESVESAKAAAKHARVRRTLDKLNCSNYDELQTSFFNPPPGGGGRGELQTSYFSSPPGRPPGGGGRGGRRRRTHRNDLEASS